MRMEIENSSHPTGRNNIIVIVTTLSRPAHRRSLCLSGPRHLSIKGYDEGESWFCLGSHCLLVAFVTWKCSCELAKIIDNARLTIAKDCKSPANSGTVSGSIVCCPVACELACPLPVLCVHRLDGPGAHRCIVGSQRSACVNSDDDSKIILIIIMIIRSSGG